MLQQICELSGMSGLRGHTKASYLLHLRFHLSFVVNLVITGIHQCQGNLRLTSKLASNQDLLDEI